MASTNKTELLKLPQWQDNDKLEMTDLNDAFEKVDTGLETHLAESKHKGVLLSMTENIAVPNSTFMFLPWDNVVYDTNGFYNASKPTRITIPSGITKIRVASNVCFNLDNNGARQGQIQKNNADVIGSGSHNMVGNNQVYNILNLASAVLPVVAGDYFEVRVHQTSGGSLETRNFSATMWFSLEVVETA